MVACMNSRNPKCQAVLHSGLPGKLCRRPARPGRRAGPTATTHRQTIDCSTIPRKRFCTCAQAANDSESSCERTWVSARSSSASIEVMPSFWQRRLNANSVPAVALDPPPPPGGWGSSSPCFVQGSLICAKITSWTVLQVVGSQAGSDMPSGLPDPVAVLRGHTADVQALHFDETENYLWTG